MEEEGTHATQTPENMEDGMLSVLVTLPAFREIGGSEIKLAIPVDCLCPL